jgi:twitching motility protein PilT
MQPLTIDDAQSEKIATALSQCPLFRALKAEHFPQIIKIGEALRFEPDEFILKQGEPSDSFFILIEGAASVRLTSPSGETHELGRVPFPSSAGEIGLLLQGPRSASVVATEDSLVMKFSSRAFDAMFQKILNFGVGLSAGLAYRLQQVSGKIPLPEYDSRKGAPSQEVLGLLPVEFMQRHRVLPVESTGNVLTLGFVDDPTTQAMTAVRDQLPGLELRVVRIDPVLFNEALRSRAGVKAWAEPGRAPVEVAEPRSPRLDVLLERMVGEGASDLHLAAGFKPMWRIDGDMHTISDASALGPNEVYELLDPVMDPRHREQFASDNDTDLGYTLPGVGRFRVNIYRDRRGVGASLRLIPSKIMTLEQLGMPPVFKTLSDQPKGLVLVTGPTGSGKSTTLAAMVDYIKRSRKGHIITLEDPIEFVHESGESLITQREVGGHTTSFARALRAALREDPNVVLVGEMRDQETMALALETANTGHLVLATLHTNTAISAVDRIIDQFPAERQSQVRSTLADVLRGVVSQTLCRKIGGGRIPALEVLVVNFAIANLIREAKTVQIPGIMQANRASGMCLLNDELGRMVDAKKIEMDEAMSKAVDKDELQRRYRNGLTITENPPARDSFRVMAVVADSPAAACGMQRGDLLCEIETKPANTITLEEARMILRADGMHALVVERGGKRLKLAMELKRY